MRRSPDGLAKRAQPRPSGWRRVGQILRAVLLALLVAFGVGFVIGTLIRQALERPVEYYGAGAIQLDRALCYPEDVAADCRSPIGRTPCASPSRTPTPSIRTPSTSWANARS